MGFKFGVGENVEYKPLGGKPGLFEVVRQMPTEDQALDRRYRIKNAGEGFERNVMEIDLNPADDAASYVAVPQVTRAKIWE